MKRSSHGLEDFGFSKKATVCDANTVDCESSTNDDTAHIQQSVIDEICEGRIEPYD